MKTLNLGVLYFWKSPGKIKSYLQNVNQVWLSNTLFPIEPVELSSLLGRAACRTIALPFEHIKPGSTPLVDVATLAALVKKKRPIRIFEIGTFEGLTAATFAKNSEDRVDILTLDLPPRQDIPRTPRSFTAQSIAGQYESGYLIGRLGCHRQVKRLFGDSALFDFQPYKDTIDFFFIDGAHTSDYVARDSWNAFHSIAPEGWVIWHDCFVPEVNKVLRWIARYHSMIQITGTNLVLTMKKPGSSFPWKRLERKR